MNKKEIVILDAVALFHLNKSDPPKILKPLQEKIIKNEIKVVIPAIAILEILWKKRKQGIKSITKLKYYYLKWKASPNITIDSLDITILDQMMDNKDSYELHDEIIAMTCKKYQTKTIYTRDPKLRDFWGLDIISW